MISPCNNCPFRRSVQFPISTERRAEIAQSVLGGQLFWLPQDDSVRRKWSVLLDSSRKTLCRCSNLDPARTG